jgi:hypothetical protein
MPQSVSVIRMAGAADQPRADAAFYPCFLSESNQIGNIGSTALDRVTDAVVATVAHFVMSTRVDAAKNVRVHSDIPTYGVGQCRTTDVEETSRYITFVRNLPDLRYLQDKLYS